MPRPSPPPDRPQPLGRRKPGNRAIDRIGDASLLEDAAAIDARYGLEPVFDPAVANADGEAGAAGTAGAGGGASFQSIECPYCGERFETLVDLSAGSADYIEDCQVCCQPIEFSVKVDDGGRLARLRARRGD